MCIRDSIVVTFYNIAPGVERLDRVDVSMGLALNALNIISMRNVPCLLYTSRDELVKFIRESKRGIIKPYEAKAKEE